MFTRQAPNIGTSLLLGGLSAPQASEMQNLLGNCRQTLVHRGPVELDYTRPNMRLITPELAKFHFPSFRFDPPEVPRKKKPDEDPPPDVAPDEPLGPDPEAPQAPQDPQDPSDPQYEYTAGDYIDITDRKVSLKHNDARRHCVFPTNFNVQNTVNSVEFKVVLPKNVSETPGKNSNSIKLSIEEKPRETLWKLDYKLTEITYVKNVRLDVCAMELHFERGTAKVFDPQDATPAVIPLTTCDTALQSPLVIATEESTNATSYTIQITNFDQAFTWSATVTEGDATFNQATGLITVTTTVATTVTITACRPGWVTATKTISFIPQ